MTDPQISVATKVCFGEMWPETDERGAQLRALARWTYRDGRKRLGRADMRDVFEAHWEAHMRDRRLWAQNDEAPAPKGGQK